MVVDDVEKGLGNYWGYNTLGFFAPMARYSSCGDSGGQVNAFKQLVKDLLAAVIDVLLVVFYNHPRVGNQLGPTLSFKCI